MASEPTSPASTPGCAPDWAAFPGEVHCPLCGYSLRGLTESRCPECGYRFDWAEVLDPDRQPHPYLFEHHPERNIRSFCRTLAGGLRPRRFWRTLRPTQPSSLRRLLVYGLLTWLVCLVLSDYTYGGYMVNSLRWQINRNRRDQQALQGWPAHAQQPVIREYGSMQAYAELMYPTHVNLVLLVQAWNQVPFWWPGWVWLPGWLLTTLGTLLIFRMSMHRARIRLAHVLRCIVYSFDALLWAGLVVCIASLVRDGIPWSPPPSARRVLEDVQIWTIPFLVPLVICRLITAYRLYLRFDRPAATILASQFICLPLEIVGMEFHLFYWASGNRIFSWILMWRVWELL